MSKKITSLITLFSFLILTWSCTIYRWKKTPVQDVKQENRAKVKISAVQVHSGEKTKFDKLPAARIQGDSVVGTLFERTVELDKTRIKHPDYFETGAPAEIMTTDGITFKTKRILRQNENQIVFVPDFPVSIRLAEIDFVWIRKVNLPMTLLSNTVILAGILAVAAAVAAIAIIKAIFGGGQTKVLAPSMKITR